ncbi:VacJ family lipoprotein [Pararhodobacter oceanensis]|uniref:VacJ lipoprotein n=1 Tax=Pararhodobacter oceanensis TaxID=2172121 RepID=A0A2T8HUX8_9RHOB|nr:VacJ family lipoprotein [Pararhodobacter oceanensis]PVH29260.1 VacJ lipoprotein [Pararhodobacter oceanensis]
MPAPRRARSIVAVLLIGALAAGCAQAPLPSGTNDPYESVNRAWFNNNLALDQALSGDTEAETDPALVALDDEGETVVAPDAVTPQRGSFLRRIVSNFGANLGLPSTIANDLLQIRPDRAAENTLRLVINSTVGLGGLFDPAGRIGIHGRRSDFGETLHRWGVGEGAYVVLPLLGPSTERDALGLAVDLVLDPLRFALPRGEFGGTLVARGAARFADRAEYAEILDANVINTADPYAQARLLYLQTRRYHLGVEIEDEIIDPYADLYD